MFRLRFPKPPPVGSTFPDAWTGAVSRLVLLALLAAGGPALRAGEESGASGKGAETSGAAQSALELTLPLEGRSRWTTALAYSPDGKYLAAAGGSTLTFKPGDVAVYEAATGREILRFEAHTSTVWDVAFSPDGKRLATAGYEGTAKLWRLDIGEGDAKVAAAHVLEGHKNWVTAVAFSPQGDRLATASEDTTARIWKVEDGAPVAVLAGHGAAVRSVAFSPDGLQIATASFDGTVKLWNAADGKETATFRSDPEAVWAVAFSPDGGILASAGADGKVRLWDPKAVVASAGARESKPEESAEKNEKEAAGPAQKEAPGLLQVLEGHRNWITTLAFSPDGRVLASGGFDRTVHLWEIPGGAKPVPYPPLEGFPSTVWTLAFSPDGKTLAIGTGAHPEGLETVRLWPVLPPQKEGPAPAMLRNHRSWVSALAFSPDGTLLATAGGRPLTFKPGELFVWEVARGVQLAVLEGHEGPVWAVAFSPRGDRIASAGYDRTVRLWILKADGVRVHVEPLARLEGHKNWVPALAFSPDGTMLASGSEDATIRLWDAEARKELGILEGHQATVRALAFAPGGRILASASFDHTVRLWDVEARSTVSILEGHKDAVWSVAFSPNGQVLASAGADRTVRLWKADLERLAEGERRPEGARDLNALLGTLEGHHNWVTSLDFSRDGRFLASAGYDRRVLLWEVETRRLAGELGPLAATAWCVRFVPGADKLAVATGSHPGEEPTVLFFDLAEAVEKTAGR